MHYASLACTCFALSSPPNAQTLTTAAAAEIGGLLRASADLAPVEDLAGVRPQDVRLWSWGAIGELEWRISLDATDAGSDDGLAPAALLDAYARWHWGKSTWIQLGRFSGPSTRSAGFSADKQLFVDRTVIGQYFDAWDEGIALGGTLGDVALAACVQNGLDGANEDFFASARAEWTWNGGVGACEGALEAPSGWAGIIGLVYAVETDAAVDGDAWVLDAHVTCDGRWCFGGELMRGERDLASQLALVTYDDDAAPWDAYASWVAVPDAWELGLRYQDLDDPDATTLTSAVACRFFAGHAAKLQLEWTRIDSELDLDGSRVGVGLSIGTDG